MKLIVNGHEKEFEENITLLQVLENLGLVGETGVTDSKGPRLHFEVRYHQSPQNPSQWLRARNRGGQ